MSCEIDVQDRFGNRVVLDHSNWEKHRPRHPEAVQYHDDIVTVLGDPDAVIERAADGSWHYYRGGLTRGEHRGLLLRVIVGWYGETGRTRPAIWCGPWTLAAME